MMGGRNLREIKHMLTGLDERGRLDFLVTLAHDGDDLLDDLAEERAAGKIDDKTASIMFRSIRRLQDLAHVASDAGTTAVIATEVHALYAEMITVMLGGRP